MILSAQRHVLSSVSRSSLGAGRECSVGAPVNNALGSRLHSIPAWGHVLFTSNRISVIGHGCLMITGLKLFTQATYFTLCWVIFAFFQSQNPTESERVREQIETQRA